MPPPAVLLVCMFIAMTVIGAKSVSEGDIDYLLYPTDYEGNVCGKTPGFENRNKLYTINSKVPSGCCVQGCPPETDANAYICVYSIPDGDGTAQDVADGLCNQVWETVDVANRCIFAFTDAPLPVDSFAYTEKFSQFYYDVVHSTGSILGFGLGGAAFLGLVLIGLMSLPGVVFILVWVAILLILASWILLGYGSYAQYDDWKSQDPRQRPDSQINAALGFAIACWVLAGLWFLLILFMRKRIQLAIGVIKQAMRAVIGMPIVLLWPVVQLAAIVLFLVAWLYYAVYTASLGDFVEEDVSGVPMRKFEYSDEVAQRGWFLFFCLLWTLAFIGAVGEIVLAMVFSIWFFRRDKSTFGCGTRNLAYSIGKTLSYHMGTAAFGSLIIAIVQLIRAILSYVQKRVKNSTSTLVTVAFCCCTCFFWCLEKCFRFINRNAYILTAIYGYNFCTSAKKAFFLILRNIARVGAVSVLGGFILFIFRAVVVGLCAAATYYYIYWEVDSEDVSSPVGPAFLTAILAYTVAGAFANVVGMGISTILICFVVDEEAFDGYNRYADPKLVSYVDKHGGKED